MTVLKGLLMTMNHFATKTCEQLNMTYMNIIWLKGWVWVLMNYWIWNKQKEHYVVWRHWQKKSSGSIICFADSFKTWGLLVLRKIRLGLDTLFIIWVGVADESVLYSYSSMNIIAAFKVNWGYWHNASQKLYSSTMIISIIA